MTTPDGEFDLSKRAGYKLYEDWIEHVTEDDVRAYTSPGTVHQV